MSMMDANAAATTDMSANEPCDFRCHPPPPTHYRHDRQRAVGL